MSHSFDCLVDTTEMAHEVSKVNHHVDATTTAVVGMQAAVIKAQKDGADHVCRKVNQGFYAMIHSQISQKMAKLQSLVDAQLMRLNQQRKQLVAIRSRMERDYQMISARYAKLFNGLNRNLRIRVTELDKPVLDFATTEADKVTNRSAQLTSVVPIGQSESIATSQKVTTSNLKYRAAKAVESIDRFIAASNRLQAMTNRILLPRPIDTPVADMVVPVAVFESNFDNTDKTQTRVYVSQIDISDQARSAVESRFLTDGREGALRWKDSDTIDPEVQNQYRILVEQSGLDERRRRAMLSMFGANPFQTF